MTAHAIALDPAARDGEVPDLTRSQRQVLERLLLGESHGQIAAQLRISTSAVESALKNARDRLGAGHTAQLAALAISYGILDDGPLRASAEARRLDASR